MASPRGRLTLVFLLALLLGALFLPPLLRPAQEPASFSEFLDAVERGEVRHVNFAGRTAVVSYRSGETESVTVPDVNWLVDRLEQADISYQFALLQGRSPWAGILSALLPALVVVGLLWMMTRQGGSSGSLFRVGRSPAQVYVKDGKRVTMKDVAGLPEVKEELAEIVDFLQHPERYLALGARIPRGVLLEGPPGTGKTLLARAVAGEAGVPFHFVAGSDFVEMFAGVGAARVRDLFEKARQMTPCVVFVDEIDAVGRHRGRGFSGAHDEREQTLNQLLVEMDGFGPAEGILVMAATNRADVLDPALLRAGRFDRVIRVDPPDRQGREAILQVHAQGKRLQPEVDLGRVAALTVGFTGADLANLLNEAALLTARHRRPAIGMPEIEQAYERIITGGPERRSRLSPRERMRVAFHEAGHALVSRKLPGTDPIQKVTIVPRGGAGGYVLYRQEEDRHMYSRGEILDRLAGMLAGRAAEEVALGEVSTGASNDLQRATELARRMVTLWGMDNGIGPVLVSKNSDYYYAGLAPTASTSERLAVAVDTAVRRLITESYQLAVSLLHRHREALERVARALLERETLSGSELDSLIGEGCSAAGD